jgi:hypothetical protein
MYGTPRFRAAAGGGARPRPRCGLTAGLAALGAASDGRSRGQQSSAAASHPIGGSLVDRANASAPEAGASLRRFEALVGRPLRASIAPRRRRSLSWGSDIADRSHSDSGALSLLQDRPGRSSASPRSAPSCACREAPSLRSFATRIAKRWSSTRAVCEQSADMLLAVPERRRRRSQAAPRV